MNLLCLASETSAPGADEFVPVLVYVVIHSNPPDLLSTMQYVTNFYDKRLRGEEAYYWMQFCAAIAFIKTLRSDTNWTLTSLGASVKFAAIQMFDLLGVNVLTVKFVWSISITFYFQLRSFIRVPDNFSGHCVYKEFQRFNLHCSQQIIINFLLICQVMEDILSDFDQRPLTYLEHCFMTFKSKDTSR